MIDVQKAVNSFLKWNNEMSSKGKAWIDLLYLANTKKEYSRNSRNVWFTIEVGQVGISVVRLSNRWQWIYLM